MRLSLSRTVPGARGPAPATHATALALDAVRACFGTHVVLDDISMQVAAGEIVCFLGPSGSGKSTLLRLIAGVDRPADGRIAIDGTEVAGPGRFVEPEHRRVGMVFQDYALFPHLTIAENVAFGLRGLARAAVRTQVDAMLGRLGLREYAGRYPHMLSGGERQRVALARAMAPGPRVLLMDEPFSSLDVRLRDEVRRYTLDYLRETGTTTIIVTHDPDEALQLGDRLALLNGGRLIQFGTPDDIYAHPASLFAARLLGDVNVVTTTCAQGCFDTPLGRFAGGPFRDGNRAHLCIRPEHLRIAAHPAAVHGQVLDVARLGEVDLVRLNVPGIETPVRLRAFGRTHVRPGDHLPIEVLPDHGLLLPLDSNTAAIT